MIIESEHLLVRPINDLALVWDLPSVLVQNLVNFLGIDFLQVLQINALEHLFLFSRKVTIFLLLIKRINQVDLFLSQLYWISFIVKHNHIVLPIIILVRFKDRLHVLIYIYLAIKPFPEI
jgi:hypothetical protein